MILRDDNVRLLCVRFNCAAFAPLVHPCATELAAADFLRSFTMGEGVADADEDDKVLTNLAKIELLRNLRNGSVCMRWKIALADSV